MVKKQLLLSTLILSIASNNTFSMFNKFTKPAEEALKKQFASTFNFSNIIPESLDTLIAYNKNKRNNAIVRLFLAVPVAAMAILLKIDMISPVNHLTTSEKKWLIDGGERDRYNRIRKKEMIDRTLTSLFCITSLIYTARKGYSACTRQWMIHHLNKIKNNKSNFWDTLTVKSYTHQDIKNSISHAKVVPADKKTDTTITLNINNPETLAKILSDGFNKPENILTTIQ